MKLKSLYVTARGDAEREAQLIRSALSSIYEIRTIRNELRLQVRGWSGPVGEVARTDLLTGLRPWLGVNCDVNVVSSVV